MKVMPGALGQVAQNVADNIFELGQSTVKATADVVTGVAGETIEQLTGAPSSAQITTQGQEGKPQDPRAEERRIAAKRRYEEVKAEMAQYIQRRKQLDQQIAEERAVEKQQSEAIKQQKKDSWVSKIINRATTSTERGRSQE